MSKSVHKSRPRIQLLIIFLTVFIDLVGFGLIIPLNPYLAREFGATPTQVGLLMAIFSLMQFLFSPFWGSLSDRFGRRPIILISLLGTAVSHAAFGFSTELWQLFAARLFAGIFGANISAAMAYMADITPKDKRSQSMGLIGAAFGLGFILGPLIGGLCAETSFGPNLGAFVAGGLGLANAVFAYFFLTESRPAGLEIPARVSRWKTITHGLDIASVRAIMIMMLFQSLAMAHMEASLFMLMQDRFSWSLRNASLGFAYIGVIIVFTQGFLVRRILPKFGERGTILIGVIFGIFGFSGISLSHDLMMAAFSVTLMGIGNGLANPALIGSLSLLSDQGEQGQRMGVSQSLAALGRILGPASGGWMYQYFGQGYPFFVSSTLMLLSLCLVMVYFTHLPKNAQKNQSAHH